MSNYIIFNIDGPLTEINNDYFFPFEFAIHIDFFQDNIIGKKHTKTFEYRDIIPKEIKIENIFDGYENEFQFRVRYTLNKETISLKKNVFRVSDIPPSFFVSSIDFFNKDGDDIKIPERYRYYKAKQDNTNIEITLLDIHTCRIYRNYVFPEIKMTGVSNYIITHFIAETYITSFSSNINNINEKNIKKAISDNSNFVDFIKIHNISHHEYYSVLWYIKRYPISKFQFILQKEGNLLEF